MSSLPRRDVHTRRLAKIERRARALGFDEVALGREFMAQAVGGGVPAEVAELDHAPAHVVAFEAYRDRW